MTVADGVDLRVEFTADPAAFLAAAGDHLAEQALVSTVVTTVAHRAVRDVERGSPPPAEDWWAVVRDRHGQVVGAAMRTAPFAPRPIYVLPMPDPAAVLLARALHARGEVVTEVNGSLPATELCAREIARGAGGAARVLVHTRLHVLRELRPLATAPGRLVVAGEDDLDLVEAWFDAFHHDADEQAGRAPASGHRESPGRNVIRSRIEASQLWFWTDEHGRRVHMTGVNAPALGVSRVGPVYTPPAHRGRGYASSAVAEVSRRILARGDRPCLFTDQANPTSNKIYAALGYEPVVDTAEYTIEAHPIEG